MIISTLVMLALLPVISLAAQIESSTMPNMILGDKDCVPIEGVSASSREMTAARSKFRCDLMTRISSVTEQNENLEKRLRACVDECHACKEDHALAKINLMEEAVQRRALEMRVSELEDVIKQLKGNKETATFCGRKNE